MGLINDFNRTRLYYAAHKATKKGNYHKTIERYTELIENVTNNNEQLSDAYMCRAITYYKDLKDYKSAILDLNKAIELSPKNDEHLAKRALVFTICGEKQSALNDIKKSLEINPNNTIAQNLLKQVKD